MAEVPAAVSAQRDALVVHWISARRLRRESQQLRIENRLVRRRVFGERSRALDFVAAAKASTLGLGELFELGDVDELEDVRPLLELVSPDA